MKIRAIFLMFPLTGLRVPADPGSAMTGFLIREMAMILREAELAAPAPAPAPAPATRPAALQPGDTGRAPEAGRLEALSLRAQRAWRNALVLSGRAQTIRAMRTEVSAQELLNVSPLARLHARAATMPVIEQAKGILMARQGCGEDEAFDLLRRASQRSNTPIRVLAEHIVKKVPQRRGPSRSANGSKSTRQ